MNDPGAPPYNTLSAYLKTRFGQRVQKIPLDAGFTCPNRDGFLSRHGCTFCNAEGSGTGLGSDGLSLARQWEHWRNRLAKRYKAKLYLAYLQSYTNTYGPLSRIQQVLDELQGLPGLAGLSMGTRPDCVDADKLDLIAAFPAEEIHLELGLQSANDATLVRINRGHDAASFARACEMAHQRGIKVVAHLMAGLPGEDAEDFLASVDFVSGLPVHGVKLHNLYICLGSTLDRQYRQGGYVPLELSSYVSMVAEAIARLRPDIIVHRINGDPSGDELVAPSWARNKQQVMDAIRQRLDHDAIEQGVRFHPSGQA